MTYEEKKELSKADYRAQQGIHTTETTPTTITQKHIDFAKELGGEIELITVVADPYGLYGWCSDGVEEKISNEGGDIVFGWTIWEWPKLMLTAEFHAVYKNENEHIFDITPKPHGEKHIAFVRNNQYKRDFDFDLRPRNQRIRIYEPIDVSKVVDEQIEQMSSLQRSYEERRATKKGMDIKSWMMSKQKKDDVPYLVDELICCVNERDELMDAIQGYGAIEVNGKLKDLFIRSDKIVKKLRSVRIY
ncbi:hypothetical protein [Hwanghaeella sp. LZ110]|uniref:hypothetical protein n=1 Tax=Hwanghaeella sp. LZ110 TaxID=3402810 RepID=UPI003B6798B1